MYQGLAISLAVVLLGTLSWDIYRQAIHGREDDATPDYATAEGLKKLGLKPGDKVAALAFDQLAYWAYLDRLNILAEIPAHDACEFWHVSPAVQIEVLQKLSQVGVKAVVANTGGGLKVRHGPTGPAYDLSCSSPGPGWQKIEGTVNHAYILR